MRQPLLLSTHRSLPHGSTGVADPLKTYDGRYFRPNANQVSPRGKAEPVGRGTELGRAGTKVMLFSFRYPYAVGENFIIMERLCTK